MDNTGNNTRRGPTAKRPYSKPLVESFELFERRSLTCGTQPNTGHTPGCNVYHSSVV